MQIKTDCLADYRTGKYVAVNNGSGSRHRKKSMVINAKFWSRFNLMHYRVIVWTLFGISIICAFGILSIKLEADYNWDLRNYHFYSPYAVLNDRLNIDHNAAGLQTTINPTLDILTTYPLLRYTTPTIFCFILGGFQGVNFLLLMMISLEFLRKEYFAHKSLCFLFSLLAAVAGVMGALSFSEIGTTFADLTLSVLNLISIYIVIRINWQQDLKNNKIYLIFCGLMIGLSAGLKLTNIIYLFGLLITFILVFIRKYLNKSIVVCFSALTGFVIAHGWWSIYLWEEYRNPIFPFFNSIFKSERYPITSVIDKRFLPIGLIQKIFYPFFFSHGTYTAEPGFIDFRFPLAYICLILLLTKLILNLMQGEPQRIRIPKIMVFLWGFTIISYVLWQYEFSIQRYAITIELLLPLLIFVTLLQVVPRYAKVIFVVCIIGFFLTTKPPDWGRSASLENFFYDIRGKFSVTEINSLDNSAIILGHQPLGWIAPALNLKNAIWLGKPFNERDKAIAIKKLRTRKSVYFITSSRRVDIDDTRSTLFEYGFSMRESYACKQLANLLICRE